MKQFLIAFFFIILCFNSNSLAAQGSNQNYDTAKKDTAKYAILASETHSASDCGSKPSDGEKPPFFRIVIEDILSEELKELATATTYRAKVKVNITAPYRKQHTFNFMKKRGRKQFSPWIVDVPCYVEKATFTIDVQQKGKGQSAFKPINLNPKSNKNQLVLNVDFSKQKIYAPDQSKTLLGGFGKTMTTAGKKSKSGNNAALKFKIKSIL